MTDLSNAFLCACLGVSRLLPSAWRAVEPSKLHGNHKMSASLSITPGKADQYPSTTQFRCRGELRG